MYAINRNTSMRRRISSYASSDRWSGREGGASEGSFFSGGNPAANITVRQRRSLIEEGLLEGLRDNYESEHMRNSEKINIKDMEESKVIIEKYRKRYLKKKQNRCCLNTITQLEYITSDLRKR